MKYWRIALKTAKINSPPKFPAIRYILFSKELLVRWARDVYEFSESQITGTVELVTDSTFELTQVSIQGCPRQIPDEDPNRFPSLVVPGPYFPGTGEVKQPSLCILLTLDT